MAISILFASSYPGYEPWSKGLDDRLWIELPDWSILVSITSRIVNQVSCFVFAKSLPPIRQSRPSRIPPPP